MGHYDIRIADTKGIFSIVSRKYTETKGYCGKDYCFGQDFGEESDLIITVDLLTGEILGIWCTNKLNAIEAAFLYDDGEFHDLQEKRKASFITPKDALYWDGTGYIRDFTMYFSKQMIKVWIGEGEPVYRYSDDRLVIYYDADYDLINFYIKGVTEDEFATLHEKKQQAWQRYL